jgi:hypothetical protein
MREAQKHHRAEPPLPRTLSPRHERQQQIGHLQLANVKPPHEPRPPAALTRPHASDRPNGRPPRPPLTLASRADVLATEAALDRRVAAEGSDRTALACVERLAVLLPKANEEAQAKIQGHLALVQAALQRDLLLLKDETKLQTLAAKVGEVKDEQLLAKAGADRLTGAVEDFLQKQGVSQFKGAASEALLVCTMPTRRE